MALYSQGSRLRLLGGFRPFPSGNYATGVHQANGIGALTNQRADLFSIGDADVLDRSEQGGVPYGARPPYCWALPQVSGAIKSFRRGDIGIDGAADMLLGVPLTAAGDAALDGAAAIGIVLSLSATGTLALDGSVVLSNVVAVTAAGSVALDGTASLTRLVSLLGTGSLVLDGEIDLMKLQSFSATDAVVSGSTQEIIDGVVAGLAGQTGLTPTQSAQLRELWQKEGLDATLPVKVTKTKITIGDPLNPLFEIALSGDLKNVTTMTRQP